MLYRAKDSEVAKFEWSQIKRQFNVFSLCWSFAPPQMHKGIAHRGFGVKDFAKLRFFFETGKKILQNKNKNVNLQRETIIKIYYNYDTDCKEKEDCQEKEKSALSSKM